MMLLSDGSPAPSTASGQDQASSASTGGHQQMTDMDGNPLPQTASGGAGQQPPGSFPPAAGTPGPGDIDPDDLDAVRAAEDQVFLGVIQPDGTVRLYPAGPPGSGLPSGHRDLKNCPSGSQGFSIHVKDGQVTIINPASTLNTNSPGFTISGDTVSNIQNQLPMSGGQ